MKRLITIFILCSSPIISAQNRNGIINLIEEHYKNIDFLSQWYSSNLISNYGEEQNSNAQSLNQLLEQCSTHYTTKSAEYATSVLYCAFFCLSRLDNIQGKQLLETSKRLFRQYGRGTFQGKDTLCEIFCLDIEAKIENNSGRDFMAVILSKKSCDLKRVYFGAQSEVYLHALLDLSRLYTEVSLFKKAIYYHNLGYDAYVERIKSEFCSASESERAIYWEKAKTYINKTISIAHQMSRGINQRESQYLASAAYNALLLSKGLLLNATIGFENYVNSSGNEEAIGLLRLKKTLKTSQATQNELDSLDYAILTILQQSGHPFNLAHLSIRWEDVATQLGDDDLAIEFYMTDRNDYGAILLKKGWKSPKIIKLKNTIKLSYPKRKMSLSNTLDVLSIESYTFNLVDDYWSLSKCIWTDDIINYFPKTINGHIWFAADGQFQMTGIEYMPFIKPKREELFYSLADVYAISRLSSTRELVLRQDIFKHKTATLYGGIKYDMSGDEILAESEQYSSSTILASRGIENDTLDRGSVKYLPGTKKEVESINKMLQDNKLSVQLFSATNANEESFKALSGKHQNILHIATHGFYWSDSTAQKKDYFSQRMLMMDNNMPTPPAIDPLNRCGLLFAGANTALSGHSAELPEGVQDGILTAKEISLLDLRDADLVVLSACETGKGEITGEGVFGLQRAFKQAGAQTIIMSLWPVNDAATQLLMTEFYRNWITNNQSKREAFRNAQNTVRSNYAEPVYWAGFIMLD